MTIEEKARAYDEAIEIARKINSGEGVAVPPDWTICEVIFPALKESEDEKIRKALIRGIESVCKEEEVFAGGFTRKQIVSWLEKQGEHRSCDSIELKFKVGDWIIFNEHHNSVYQVEKIQGLRYYLRHYNGGSMSVHIDNQLIRHWSIQYAKDGDVLATNDWVFIFKGINNNISCYCHYDYDEDMQIFNVDTNYHMTTGSPIYPATKEQRDLLFQKMKEAGYEWDAVKKELRKIEQQRSVEWSEEDEKVLDMIISDYTAASKSFCGHQGKLDFLKSLKSQSHWKPSDEQIKAFEHFVRSWGESGTASPYDNNNKLIYSLLEDLKKLREE